MRRKLKYPDTNFGVRATIDLTEAELHEAFRQMKEVDGIIRSAITKPVKNAMARDRRRLDRERRMMEANPVKCSECQIKETCAKRKHHRLSSCTYGIRIKEVKVVK